MWTLKVKANEDIAIISRRRVMLKLYINENSIYNVGFFKVFEITC